MEVLGNLLAIAALIVVVAYIAQPFLSSQQERAAGEGLDVLRQRADLLAARNELYAALRQLDADHGEGTLTEAEYAEGRVTAVAQAVDLLQQLDTLPAPADDDPLERLIHTLRSADTHKEPS